MIQNIIIFLIITSTIFILKIGTLNTKINNLEKENNLKEDELQYTKRELERYKNQVEALEKEEAKSEIMIMNNKVITKSFLYKGKRVLVGDYDDMTYRNTINVIKSFGIKVDIVNSGKDIVDRIKHGYKYDIIFTNNIYKEGYDGPSTLMELKKIKNFHIPVVIHTSSSNKNHDFDIFDGYIEKPVTQEKLKPILDKFLNNH